MEINFEFSRQWHSVFERDLDPVRICDELELMSGIPLKGGKTLLFFDEIQLCPKALAALRFFYERLPNVPVIAAGSLLPESVKVAPTLARWGSHHGLIWSCRPGGDFTRAGFRLPERIFSAA